MDFRTIGKYVAFIMLIIIGIYAFKWLNSQYKIPVVGEMIEAA